MKSSIDYFLLKFVDWNRELKFSYSYFNSYFPKRNLANKYFCIFCSYFIYY